MVCHTMLEVGYLGQTDLTMEVVAVMVMAVVVGWWRWWRWWLWWW